MSERSKKFKGKIRACRGIARTGGVIAAASMALVSRGYGEALRYQINDHLPPGPEQGYDIDQDGDLDVFFNWDDPIGVQMEGERYSYGGAGNTGWVFLDPMFSHVKGFVADEWIGHTHDNVAARVGYLNLGESGPFYNPPSPLYAGFCFVGPDTLYRYAWAELRVTGTEIAGFELDIIAFGYETEPDSTLQAGRPLIPVPTKSASWGEIKSLYGK